MPKTFTLQCHMIDAKTRTPNTFWTLTGLSYYRAKKLAKLQRDSGGKASILAENN